MIYDFELMYPLTDRCFDALWFEVEALNRHEAVKEIESRLASMQGFKVVRRQEIHDEIPIHDQPWQPGDEERRGQPCCPGCGAFGTCEKWCPS